MMAMVDHLEKTPSYHRMKCSNVLPSRSKRQPLSTQVIQSSSKQSSSKLGYRSLNLVQVHPLLGAGAGRCVSMARAVLCCCSEPWQMICQIPSKIFAHANV